VGALGPVLDVRPRRLLRFVPGATRRRRHFRHTDHPVMRSVEPGEAWRWCYVDRVVG
jgi:hypothetical protein